MNTLSKEDLLEMLGTLSQWAKEFSVAAGITACIWAVFYAIMTLLFN